MHSEFAVVCVIIFVIIIFKYLCIYFLIKLFMFVIDVLSGEKNVVMVQRGGKN